MKINITFPNESTPYELPIEIVRGWTFEVTNKVSETYFCLSNDGQVFSIEESEYQKL